MKIEMKITPRDVKLLIIMGAALLVLGYYYLGIKPLTEKIDTLDTQIESLEMQKTQMQMKIAAIPKYETAVKENTAKLNELKKDFFDLMTNEDAGKYITDLFVDNKLSILDTTINSPALNQVEPYIYSTAYLQAWASQYSQDESSGDGNSTSGSTAAEIAASDPSNQMPVYDESSYTTANVLSCCMTISAVGTKKNVLNVLDELSEQKGIRIQDFDIDDALQSSDMPESYISSKKITIDLIMYMNIR